MPKEPVAYEFGEFRLDVRKRELRKLNGEVIQLANNPYNLLLLLIENRQRTVQNEEIYNEIWKNDLRGGGNLEELVSTLRRSLGDKEKKIIITKSKLGKMFGIEVKEVHEENLETFPDKNEFPKDSLNQTATENKTAAENSIGEIENPVEETRPALQPERKPAEIEFNNAVEESPDNAALSDKPPTFEAWLGASGIKWWFAVIIIATVALSIFYNDNNHATFFGSVAQLFIVSVSLAYYYSFLQFKDFRSFTDDLDTKETLKKEVKEAIKHEDVSEWLETRRNAEDAFGYITTCWQILLVVWLALYGLLAYQVLYSEQSVGLKQIITIANNCNTLMLILCFSAFNRLEKIEKGSKWNLKDKKWLFGIAVIVVLAVVEAVCINNYAEIGRRLGNNALKIEDVLWFFRVVSGLSGAIAMALFVGRLQSKFFNPPAKLIAALYSYTAIQPLFVFFDDESKSMPFITALVIHVALILKSILFLYLFWTFETGRLLFYLVRVRLTNKEVEKEWQDFQTVLEKNIP